jgi:hypothetical protein
MITALWPFSQKPTVFKEKAASSKFLIFAHAARVASRTATAHNLLFADARKATPQEHDDA